MIGRPDAGARDRRHVRSRPRDRRDRPCCRRRPASRPDVDRPDPARRRDLRRRAGAVSLGSRRGARGLFRRDLVRAGGAHSAQDRRNDPPGASAAGQAADGRRHRAVWRQPDRLAGDERRIRRGGAGGDVRLVAGAHPRHAAGFVGDGGDPVRRGALRSVARRHARHFPDGVRDGGARLLHLFAQGAHVAAPGVHSGDAQRRLPRAGQRLQAVGRVPVGGDRRDLRPDRPDAPVAHALRRAQRTRFLRVGAMAGDDAGRRGRSPSPLRRPSPIFLPICRR